MNLHMDSVQVEQGVRDWNNQLFVQAAATAWFLYDYALTLPDEIRYVWWRRFSSVKLAFLGMRYAALANLLHSVDDFGRWYLFSQGPLGCRIIWRVNAVTGTIFYVSFAVFIALRIHVISGRNITASLSTLCLSLAFVCCDGFRNITRSVFPRPFTSGCMHSVVSGGDASVISGQNPSLSAVYTVIGLAGTGCLFVAELIVQSYTWRNTWRLVRETKNIRTRKSLLFFMLRDGSVAWVILTVWVISSEIVSSVDLRPMTILCISIVVCRVIVRLRQVELSDSMDSTPNTKSWISASFIGNVGAPLDLSDRQDRYLDEDDAAESSSYARRNRPEVDLEAAQVIDGGSV